ncbi:unnamed protein product [Microthlaspi erraticum]|uniref:KIB1-4 beta-propeller domain-containing protein n=1 Tax=Microthlaspi erraticum TaxID=1685480 RepID=A0A6D2JZQ1_9BRAS|nr:unnamed protein product [Microthlaspi erraticum]
MAYKDDKLYVYTLDHCIKILDLSSKEVTYRNNMFHIVLQLGVLIWKTRIAIASTGEVLIVLSLKWFSEERFFHIYKMNIESGEWERIDSLEGEMLIFGYGVTVRAPIKDSRVIQSISVVKLIFGQVV